MNEMGVLSTEVQKIERQLRMNGRDIEMPSGILENLKRPSNQVFQKNADDSLEGVRYIVSTEPSTLRPVRSWTVMIEKWECETMADITAHDVLFIRIANSVGNEIYDYVDIVRDIEINGQKIEIAKL